MSVIADVRAAQQRVAEIAGRGSVSAASELAALPKSFVTLVRGSLALLLRHEAQRAGLDPALLEAVAAAESDFDPAATSRAGAAGLMQLMPETAAALGVTDLYDPAQNVRGGATYLRDLLERFGGELPSAIAAYNAGPAAVERWHGPPPYAETRAYVARVLARYRSHSQR